MVKEHGDIIRLNIPINQINGDVINEAITVAKKDVQGQIKAISINITESDILNGIITNEDEAQIVIKLVVVVTEEK